MWGAIFCCRGAGIVSCRFFVGRDGWGREGEWDARMVGGGEMVRKE